MIIGTTLSCTIMKLINTKYKYFNNSLDIKRIIMKNASILRKHLRYRITQL